MGRKKEISSTSKILDKVTYIEREAIGKDPMYVFVCEFILYETAKGNRKVLRQRRVEEVKQENLLRFIAQEKAKILKKPIDYKNFTPRRFKKYLERRKYMPRRQYYRKVFDALMDIALTDKHIPKRLFKAWDEVANYLGDVAEGRKD